MIQSNWNHRSRKFSCAGILLFTNKDTRVTGYLFITLYLKLEYLHYETFLNQCLYNQTMSHREDVDAAPSWYFNNQCACAFTRKGYDNVKYTIYRKGEFYYIYYTNVILHWIASFNCCFINFFDCKVTDSIILDLPLFILI
jgi:hypothetical protein